MTADTPLANTGEVGVGFSDTTLLVVSLVGFSVLASTMYLLIMSRLRTAKEAELSEVNEMDYDEQLDKADVATLNRAQRRARAKMIMKRQRRITPIEEQALPDNDNDNQDPNNSTSTQRHLSRKERQRAAKETERMERRILQDDRRKQQMDAQETAKREKRERQRQLAQQADLQRQQRQQQEQERKQAAYQRWKSFLSFEDDSLTVSEFVEYAKRKRTVELDLLADRFQTSTSAVAARIRQLVSEKRLTGIIVANRAFVYLTTGDLEKMAALVKSEGQTNTAQLAEYANTIG